MGKAVVEVVFIVVCAATVSLFAARALPSLQYTIVEYRNCNESKTPLTDGRNFSNASAIRHELPQNKVIIVMSDSRALDQVPTDYHKIAFEINRLYAERHGYSLQFTRTPCVQGQVSKGPKVCTSCEHPVLGPRATPWCKLLAINKTLHENMDANWVIYMDSDAIFYNHFLPVDWVYMAAPRQSTLITLYNFPWPFLTSRNKMLGCTGVQFWRNTPTARRIVQEWWDIPGFEKYNHEHDFEQSALYGLIEARSYDVNNTVYTLNVKTMVDDGDQQYIKHVGTERAGERIPLFTGALSMLKNLSMAQ